MKPSSVLESEQDGDENRQRQRPLIDQNLFENTRIVGLFRLNHGDTDDNDVTQDHRHDYVRDHRHDYVRDHGHARHDECNHAPERRRDAVLSQVDVNASSCSEDKIRLLPPMGAIANNDDANETGSDNASISVERWREERGLSRRFMAVRMTRNSSRRYRKQYAARRLAFLEQSKKTLVFIRNDTDASAQENCSNSEQDRSQENRRKSCLKRTSYKCEIENNYCNNYVCNKNSNENNLNSISTTRADDEENRSKKCNSKNYDNNSSNNNNVIFRKNSKNNVHDVAKSVNSNRRSQDLRISQDETSHSHNVTSSRRQVTISNNIRTYPLAVCMLRRERKPGVSNVESRQYHFVDPARAGKSSTASRDATNKVTTANEFPTASYVGREECRQHCRRHSSMAAGARQGEKQYTEKEQEDVVFDQKALHDAIQLCFKRKSIFSSMSSFPYFSSEEGGVRRVRDGGGGDGTKKGNDKQGIALDSGNDECGGSRGIVGSPGDYRLRMLEETARTPISWRYYQIL